jgi:hypothetical protein
MSGKWSSVSQDGCNRREKPPSRYTSFLSFSSLDDKNPHPVKYGLLQRKKYYATEKE